MKPFVEITANGLDITAKIKDYILSVEVVDEADDKSDSLTIDLDDRPRLRDGALLEIPMIGTVLGVTMGYIGGISRFMGSYKIDEISVRPLPNTLSITGRAATMTSAYRSPRSQSYHQTTLGAIIEDIATRNGYEPKMAPELASLVIRHADQHNESDMAFANRLANDYDAVAKPVDGRLVLAKRGTGQAISGESLPEIYLSQAMCSNWGFQYSARDEAGESTGLASQSQSDQKAAGES